MNGSPSSDPSNSSSNSIPLWIKVLVPLGVTPSIASIYYAFTRNPLLTLGVGIFALLITTMILIWLELQKELVRVVTDRIKDRVKHPFGYKTYYCKSLSEKHGIKEVVSVISGHTLELEQIFINPRIVDISPHSAEASPALLPASSPGRREESHSIWDFLTSKETTPLLILNAAGMGKSTLLRDIALTLADPQKRRKHNLSNKLLPFLLFLSEVDFNKQFSENDEFSLADVVEKALKKRWDKPPSGWVEHQLKRGRCFILLDGLDEIADPNIRHDVMKWIPIQIDRYPPGNRLVITSRPREYLENPLERKRSLEIQGFNNDEIVAFISKSYKAIGSDAAKIQDETDKLMKRLKDYRNLHNLARNPLLLGMIVNVHQNHGQLPESRVKLYEEIFEVCLKDRWRGLPSEHTFSFKEKQAILQKLAYEMTLQEKEKIRWTDAESLINKPLAQTKIPIEPGEFLKGAEKVGVWIKKSSDYGFAHRSFQEYLTAMYVLDTGQAEILEKHVGSDWWRDTIVLYCAAQADPTPIMNACLKGDRLSPNTMGLALALYREPKIQKAMAEQSTSEARERFNQAMIFATEKDIELQRMAAKQLLFQRKYRISFNDETPIWSIIDRDFICCLEYQLFLEQKEPTPQPDHWFWKDRHFPEGQGLEPILGIRRSDADAFCNWLTAQEQEFSWRYRLPTYEEIHEEYEDGISLEEADRACWLSDDQRFAWVEGKGAVPPSSISEEDLKDRLEQDYIYTLNNSYEPGFKRSLWLDEGISLAEILTNASDFHHKELLSRLKLINERISGRKRELQTDYDNAREYRIGRDKQLKVLKKKQAEIKGDIRKLHDLNTRLDECKKEFENFDHKADHQYDLLKKARGSVSRLRNQLPRIHNSVQRRQLLKQIHVAEARVKALQISFDKARNDKVRARAGCDGIRRQLNDFENQLTREGKQKSTLQEQLKELNEQESELQERLKAAKEEENRRKERFENFSDYADKFDRVSEDFSIFKSAHTGTLSDALARNQILDLDRILLARNDPAFSTLGDVCTSLSNFIKDCTKRLEDCHRNSDSDIKPYIAHAVTLARELNEKIAVEHVQKIHEILMDFLDRVNKKRAYARESPLVRIYIRYFANVLAKHSSFWMQKTLFSSTQQLWALQSLSRHIIDIYFDILIAFALLEKRIEKQKKGIQSASEGILLMREGGRGNYD